MKNIQSIIKITSLAVLLAVPLSAEDAEIKLNSNDGSTSFVVKDSLSVNVLKVDSDGNLGIGGNTYGSRLSIFQDGSNDKDILITSHTTAGYGLCVSSIGWVSIGSDSSAAKLFIRGSAGGWEDGVILETVVNQSSGTSIVGAKARGTLASPTIVQDGDELLNICAVGNYGGDGNYAEAAAIGFEVGGTPSGANDMPGKLYFRTTPDGSGTALTRMSIASDGKIGIGLAPDDALVRIAGSNDQLMIEDTDSSSDEKRWVLKADSGAFELVSADDAWTNWSAAMRVTRSGYTVGNVIFPSGSVGIGASSPVTKLTVSSGTVTIDGTGAGLVVGTGGAKVLNILSASNTLDFGSTTTGASTDLTITVTGAAVGDVVSLGIDNNSITTNGVFMGWVSALNTVTIRFLNNDTATQDPASGTFRAMVTKF
ncbi:MAG TPA: hypothetical protein PK876_06795 [Elusimicrobiota bacterium]|nr:hypothetical protein [Elusimicrobiota bacterium]